MKKIVYLLGAGAMIDFGGPSTSELTKECENILCSMSHSYSKIISSLEKLYGPNNFNFETIIAAVEQLLNYSIATDRMGYNSIENTNLIRILFSSNFPELNSSDLWECYRMLINSVIDRVDKYDCLRSFDLDDINHSNDVQAMLRKYLLKMRTDNNLKIYSLNYDRLIPKLLYDKWLYDATVSNGIESNFEYRFNAFLEHRLTYFNLHGSIYLKQQPNQLYSIVQSDSPNRISYAIPQRGGSPNEQIIFSPIIAGYTKSQRVMSDVFNFGFSTFFADINTCSELIVIGYSFSDPYINSVIRNASRYLETMTIVDYKNEEDFEKMITKAGIDFYDKNNGKGYYKIKSKTIYGAAYYQGFRQFLDEQILEGNN